MEKHVVEEKVLDTSIDKEDNTPDPIDKKQDHDDDDGNAGDAALANASWQFKLIALATALMLPSMLFIHVVSLLLLSLIMSHFSRITLFCHCSFCHQV